MRPAKTQISLGIHPVWSQSSLSAWRQLGSLATHWAHSEDSDQTGWMPRLIWVFAGRTVTLLVLSCRGSYHFDHCLVNFGKLHSELNGIFVFVQVYSPTDYVCLSCYFWSQLGLTSLNLRILWKDTCIIVCRTEYISDELLDILFYKLAIIVCHLKILHIFEGDTNILLSKSIVRIEKQ